MKQIISVINNKVVAEICETHWEKIMGIDRMYQEENITDIQVLVLLEWIKK